MSTKGPGEILSVHELQNQDGSEDQYDKAAGMKGGTAADAVEMGRMGRVQELRVSFATSSLSFPSETY